MPTVFVVDGDATSSAELAEHLAHGGYDVRCLTTGTEALRLGVTPAPDVIISSMRLEDMAGTELCRAVRSHADLSRTPLIMLCDSDNEIDKVVALEVGADDVVPKPYSLRELGLRVRALLRRHRHPRESTPPSGGAFRIDASDHRAILGTREVVLSALEFRLLTALFERRNRVQRRGDLLEEVWGASGVSERTVDACVKRLRQKLGTAGSAIQTVRGVGYRFADPNARDD